MVKKIINIGIEGNDATGDPIRDAFEKTNDNFNELYSFFGKGDGISFTDLTDYDNNREGKLVSESIFVVNNSGDPNVPGSKILAKTLVGDGIEVINSDLDNTITLRNLGAKLVYDPAPALGGSLNGQNNIIYNVKDGTSADAIGLGISSNSFVATQGYVGSNFVKKAGDTMTGGLNVPAGATGTQVPRRNEVVGLSGDTMTGPLVLSRDPIPTDDITYNGLIAATKNYVDTTSFSSQVNLFVSAASGNDFRFDVPEEKRGSALAYAFKTLNRACFKAEQLINAAGLELGPYQKPIFFNSGASISRAVSMVSNNDGTYTLTITNGGGSYGTDMRGTGTAPTVDVRAGLIIRGTTSGALAMITLIDPVVYSSGTITTSDGTISYTGAEKYTVIYKNFQDALKTQPVEFIAGETLEYSDSIQKLNITIFIESGEYYENLPIRVPPNVTLVGDDTRRVIIRPKTGPSGSIWSDIYFRRDVTIDGLTVLTPVSAGNFVVGQSYTIASLGTTTNTQWNTIANTTGITYAVGSTFTANTTGTSSGTGTAYCVFGYHYLTDPFRSFYNSPSNSLNISSKYPNAQKILNTNKSALQTGMASWIETNYPTYSTAYRDIGFIVDALGFDLVYSGYSKTLEAAMSYYSTADAQKVITGEELTKTKAIISELNDRIQTIIFASTNPTPEAGFDTTIGKLIAFFNDIIEKDTAVVNFPKNNDQMDVFLLNDSNRIRMLSAQGHGGFMSVLDPEGQIITKSPYIFQCSSFTKSINKQQFAGGLFVDAFTGNLSCTILERISSTKIKVGNLTFRTPTNIPVSFVINGIRFEVDYIDHPETYQAGQYNLYINSNTADDVSYTSTTNLFTTNRVLELQTAGNRSVLCSDFTQINDLGYGICASNGALIEAVSIFTYYCYRGFYSLNGSQIRSLNGSCAYGTYALSSEGSDPTEIATTANLKYPMIQILTTYSDGTLVGKNLKNDLDLYVKIDKNRSNNYSPFSSSELEIDHGFGTWSKYFVSNSSQYNNLSVDNYDIYVLSLSTSGNSNTSTTGLKFDVDNGTPVIVRVLKNFEIIHLPVINSARPSTALQFDNESDIYHLTAFSDAPQTTIATSVNSDGTINVTPGSTVGFKAGQQITFSGTTFGGISISPTTYFIDTVAPNTIKISGSALAASTPFTIAATLISNNALPISETISALKGDSFLFPSGVTGVTGLTPGYTYYIAEDVTSGSSIKLSATYADAKSASPTILTISGTPGGTRTNAYKGGYLIATIGGAKDLGSTITIDSNYNYITLSPKTGDLTNTSIQISNIGVNDRTRIIGMIFAWGTTIHKITNWQSIDTTTDQITFTNGLSKSTKPSDYSNKTPTLRAGLNNFKADGTSQTGLSLISKISVMRASGHDLVDIGTGGFANSNIPANIYGIPATPKTQANEIQEIGRGRVFYSTTDQDGNFKVGKYFQVDQGTGSVTFSASLAISNIDGLGFSRGGVTVKEFATDDTMSNQSNDTVPTQSAVVGYVNKRLGITASGAVTTNPIGPGFLTRDGTTKFGVNVGDVLDMTGHRISNLATPLSSGDAAPKVYVDSFFKRTEGIRKEINGFTMSDKTQFSILSVARSNSVATIVLRDDSTRSGIHGLSVGSTIVVSGVTEVLGFNCSENGVSSFTVKSIINPNGYVGSIGSSSTIVSFTYDNIKSPTAWNDLGTTVIGSGIVETESNISLSGAKITNLLDPTDNYDAANRKYVNDKANISALNDITLSSIADKQILYYNNSTSKWVNGLITNSNIDVSAAIAQSKLNLSNATAAAAAADATKGISSFNNASFDVSSGYVSIKANSITLNKIQTIGTGYLLGNLSGGATAPYEITPANAVNSAITIPSGSTVAPAGVVAKGTGATFSTVLYDTANTNNALVQRNSTGGINVDAISAGAITGSSVKTTGAIEAEGKITGSAAISAKTELQIDGTKIFDYNGVTTRMFNQSGGKALEVAGNAGAVTGKLYGTWTLDTGAKLQATYADLAEYYTSDNDYSSGTVVMIGGDRDVTLAKGYGTTAVAGVVSENPAYLMNVDCEGIRVAVALQGRVPCKVIGTIKKGDLLIVSQVAGAATSSKDPKPGSIIGKALADYNSDRIGMIEVLVGKH